MRPTPNHKPPRANFNIGYRNRAAVQELRVAIDESNAQPREALGRIRRAHCCNDALHVIMHLGEIDSDVLSVEAKFAGTADCLGTPGRRQQGLGGNTAGIEAIATHLAALNQHGRNAKGSRSRCHR